MRGSRSTTTPSPTGRTAIPGAGTAGQSCAWSWAGGRGSCEDTPAVGASYLAVHQQPDGEGDVEAAFGDLGLHFLPGDGRRTLAGRAAQAQAAPWLDHLGTQPGRFALRTGSSG